jgi:hypothetical protein
MLAALWLGMACAVPASTQEAEVSSEAVLTPPQNRQTDPGGVPIPACEGTAATADEICPCEMLPWQTVWGVAGVHVFAAGPKVAPNGVLYHPYHSLDLNFNLWVWRSQGLYLFAENRFFNQKPEHGVTNSKDSALGFSKRQFDMVFGPAWNYAGAWEARCFGYTYNNLNRGRSLITPAGFNDGFGMENRYYLAKEYAKLGHSGFDVQRADFLSIGYYVTKEMVDNDGNLFRPDLMLRAYLTCSLWDWPAYLFGDVTYIGEKYLQPKLLLYDVGAAGRPFSLWERFKDWGTWEIRLGVSNTADLQLHNVQNLWYGAVNVIF